MESSKSWIDDVVNELPALVDYATIAKTLHMSKGGVANLCSAGRGIEGGIIIAKKRLFPKQAVIDWILSRVESGAGKAGVK